MNYLIAPFTLQPCNENIALYINNNIPDIDEKIEKNGTEISDKGRIRLGFVDEKNKFDGYVKLHENTFIEPFKLEDIASGLDDPQFLVEPAQIRELILNYATFQTDEMEESGIILQDVEGYTKNQSFYCIPDKVIFKDNNFNKASPRDFTCNCKTNFRYILGDPNPRLLEANSFQKIKPKEIESMRFKMD